MRRNGKPPLTPEERQRLMSREFFHSDHFERGWRRISWSRPMDHAAWLTGHGFLVYLWLPPRGNPGYEQWKKSGLSSARISWFSQERDMRLWTEGHGRNDDSAIAMAYGNYTLHREKTAAGGLH